MDVFIVEQSLFYVFNNNKTNAISRWSKSIAIKLCAIS